LVAPTRHLALNGSLAMLSPVVFEQQRIKMCCGIFRHIFDRSQAHHPPCDPIARKTLPRPSHPAPNVRDDRETPLLVGRDGRSCRCDLGGTKTELFLLTGLDRKIGTMPDRQIKFNRLAMSSNNQLHPVKLERPLASVPDAAQPVGWVEPAIPINCI
jgi:hypothetical protein